jgi:ABC-type multidrug transport system fused ATPase/permease subunit
VSEFSHLSSESASHTDVSFAPQSGAIELRGLSLRYRSHLPLVLKNVSLSIPSGFKVGVIGRTGAGKSTLLSAFFRIVEIPHNSIFIDGSKYTGATYFMRRRLVFVHINLTSILQSTII